MVTAPRRPNVGRTQTRARESETYQAEVIVHGLFMASSGRCKSLSGSFLRTGGMPDGSREWRKSMRRSIPVLAVAGLLVAALAVPALARGNGNPHVQPRF